MTPCTMESPTSSPSSSLINQPSCFSTSVTVADRVVHIRSIHLCLQRQFLIGAHPLFRLVTANEDAVLALRWWLGTANLLPGQDLELYHPEVTLFTDASLSSGGAHAETFHAWGL